MFILSGRYILLLDNPSDIEHSLSCTANGINDRGLSPVDIIRFKIDWCIYGLRGPPAGPRAFALMIIIVVLVLDVHFIWANDDEQVSIWTLLCIWSERRNYKMLSL